MDLKMQLLAHSFYVCLKIWGKKAFCFLLIFLTSGTEIGIFFSLINFTYRNLPFTHTTKLFKFVTGSNINVR